MRREEYSASFPPELPAAASGAVPAAAVLVDVSAHGPRAAAPLVAADCTGAQGQSPWLGLHLVNYLMRLFTAAAVALVGFAHSEQTPAAQPASFAGLGPHSVGGRGKKSQTKTEHRMSQTTLIIILSISGNLGVLVTLRQVRFIFWRAFKERYQRLRNFGRNRGADADDHVAESEDGESDESIDEDFVRAQLQAKAERSQRASAAAADAASGASAAATARPPAGAAGARGHGAASSSAPQALQPQLGLGARDHGAASSSAPQVAREGSSEEWTDIEDSQSQAHKVLAPAPAPVAVVQKEPRRASTASSSSQRQQAQAPSGSAAVRIHSADGAAGCFAHGGAPGNRASTDSGGSGGAGGSNGSRGVAAVSGVGLLADESAGSARSDAEGASGSSTATVVMVAAAVPSAAAPAANAAPADIAAAGHRWSLPPARGAPLPPAQRAPPAEEDEDF